ncbi:choice-of-anchor B domain-containing protein [Zhouia amylolytica]|uniref:Choice-of-anchor B domain-containing protein n=1 Tax=Zhouia amylolytica TaxID=376730 RepID=A0A1I6QP26_9FLAO|nr:choice-of-anchor B family protein [Zhouia amylolytica]SFS54149.1 choice-of-anchor B domain-containing protein [Zhouia amylolytica]
MMISAKWELVFFIGMLVCLVSCSNDDDSNDSSNGGADDPIEDPVPNESLPDLTFLSQTDIPGNSLDLWGFTKNGEEHVVIAGTRNTAIVNIEDPSDPEVVSIISSAGFDVKVWENYLYIAEGGHLEGDPPSTIYNISNLESPVLVGTFPAVHNIFIDDFGYLYVSGYHPNSSITGSEGLNMSIYDLNNTPETPELIWTAPGQPSVPVHDMAVINNTLYAFDIELHKVDIYDVTDRKAPELLGTYQFTDESNVHSGWPSTSEQYLYVCLEEAAGDEDIVILDISDPADINISGTIHDTGFTVHNLYVIGNLAYTSFYRAGLRVYDITDPTDPILYYEYDTNNATSTTGAFGVYPFSESGYISVSDVEFGLYVFKAE